MTTPAPQTAPADSHEIRITFEPGSPKTWDEMTEEQEANAIRAIIALALLVERIPTADDAPEPEVAA